jgi:hypothetical protein
VPACAVVLTAVGCQCILLVYQTTGCHVRTLDAGTSLLWKLTKVAFRQTQVPIFLRSHATQQCRLEPLPEYNGQHYQSVGPGGNSYELHSEGDRLGRSVGRVRGVLRYLPQSLPDKAVTVISEVVAVTA